MLDRLLLGWFVFAGLSVVFVAYDLIVRTPEMKVMKWGWILVVLYTGPIGALVYWFSCREPAPGTHEDFVAPLWKQTTGSTIHCLAGDATGVIVAAILTSRFHFPMGVDVAVEYVFGFGFGLLVFQALFMKDMLGISYGAAVRRTFLSEWLSMNCVMAGMVPVMVIFMSRDMQAMNPVSLRFWGVMSAATLVGAVTAYPVNRWLVKNGLKHGMGTERVLGKGGSRVVPMKAMKMPPVPTKTAKAGHGIVSSSRKIGVAAATTLALAGGVAIAGHFGDLTMRAGSPISHRANLPAGLPARGSLRELV